MNRRAEQLEPEADDGAWAQLQSLFAELRDKPDSARAATLRRLDADGGALRVPLEALLQSHDACGTFLSRSAAEDHGSFDRADDSHAAPGAVVGRYTIGRIIGAGAMGVVYEAQQQHPRRSVALKVLRHDSLSADAIRRFEFEVEVLARLQHPAIAQVYDAGWLELSGEKRPFLAMELVQGLPLLAFATAKQLRLRQRIELFIRVCHGVDHAHKRGVIHRDLKPANILITDAGQPKVLDFGVARALGDDRAADSLRRTVAGTLLGTVAYMSPEQILGDVHAIDTRSDVFALGTMLFELLCHEPPHHGLDDRSIFEAARMIREVDARPLRTVDATLPLELEWIVAKALEREPLRRYGSAGELAADLERHLAGEPVLAAPPSTTYRIRKLVARHRTLATTAAAVTLSLLAGLALTTVLYFEAERQRDAADIARTEALAAERLANERTQRAIRFAQSISALAENRLANLPGGTQARRDLLALVVGSLESNIVTIEGIDSGAPLTYALQRRGELELVMGHVAAACDTQRHVFEIRNALAARLPGDLFAQRMLAVAHWKLAEVELARGDLAEAEEHNLASLALHDALAADPAHAGMGNHVGYQGIARRRLAEVQAMSGRFDDALANYALALELVSLGSEADPENENLMQTRALILCGRGETLAALGRFDEARTAIEASLRATHLLERRTEPMNLWARAHLADVRITLSHVAEMQGRFNESATAAAAAIALARPLSAADPANADTQLLLARSLQRAASAAAVCGDSAAAMLHGAEAAALLRRLIDLDKTHARAGRRLAAVCTLIAQAHRDAAAADPPAAAAHLADADDWRIRARDLRATYSEG